MTNSEKLYEEIIQNCKKNYIEFPERVKLFEYLGNDDLKVTTKQAYGRMHRTEDKAYNRLYLFAKGVWIRFKDVDLVTNG